MPDGCPADGADQNNRSNIPVYHSGIDGSELISLQLQADELATAHLPRRPFRWRAAAQPSAEPRILNFQGCSKWNRRSGLPVTFQLEEVS